MNQSNKQKIILKILIVLIVLLVVVAGGAYAYIATDFLKTPDQLFKKYLVSSIIEVANFNVDPYRDTMSRIKEEPVEITTQQKLTNPDDYEGEKTVRNMTEKVLIDYPNKNYALEVNVTQDDYDYFKFNMLQTGETVGIHVPELHDKYFAVENRDLNKLAKTLGADEESLKLIPDKFENTLFTEEKKEKLIELGAKYIEKFSSQIDETLFTKESYVIEDFDGKSFKGNKYTLTIAEAELIRLISDTFNEFMLDQEFIALFEEMITEEQLKEYKDYIAEMKIEDTSEYTEEVKLSFYESKGKALRFEVLFAKGHCTQITMLNEKESSHILVNIETVREEEYDVACSTKFDITSSFENNNGEIWIISSKTFDKKDVEKRKEKSEESQSISSFVYFSEELYEDYSQAYKISTTVDGDTITATLGMDGVEQEYMKLEESTLTVEFGSDIKVPTINEENSLIINDYTEDDFSKLGTEIIENIEKSVEENPDSLVGSYYSLMTMFSGFGTYVDTEETQELNNFEINEEEYLQEDTTQEEHSIQDFGTISEDTTEETSEETTSELDSQLQAQEVDAFNAQFTPYIENGQKGSSVKALLVKLRANADSFYDNPKSVPSIIFENEIIVYMDNNLQAYEGAISNAENQIDMNSNYNIEASYDSATGRLATVIIKNIGRNNEE